MKAAFFKYPPYFRAYLRALQDIANLAMNNAKVNPMLDAKYASFVANGLTANSAYGLLVQDPAKSGGLEDWIGTMHNSILAVLGSQGVTNVAWTINSTVVSSDVVLVSGTAPLAVKHLLVQRHRVAGNLDDRHKLDRDRAPETRHQFLHRDRRGPSQSACAGRNLYDNGSL